MKKAAKLCAFVLAGVITFGGLTACTEQNNDVVNNITLSISTTKNEIKVGETLEISVETNGDKTKVVFNSSDTSVCSVTDGVITGLKEGTAQISATLDNVTSNIINIKVTKDNEDPDVITLSISTTKTEINVNETLEVVSTTNGDTSKIIYSSSNTSIASISTSGVITGLKAGTTDISATLGNVKSNTITITVKEGTIISDTPEYLQGGFKLNDYSFTKDENFTIEDFINAIEEVLVALYSDNENIKYLLDENNNLLPSITSNEQFIDYFNEYSNFGVQETDINKLKDIFINLENGTLLINLMIGNGPNQLPPSNLDIVNALKELFKSLVTNLTKEEFVRVTTPLIIRLMQIGTTSANYNSFSLFGATLGEGNFDSIDRIIEIASNNDVKEFYTNIKNNSVTYNFNEIYDKIADFMPYLSQIGYEFLNYIFKNCDDTKITQIVNAIVMVIEQSEVDYSLLLVLGNTIGEFLVNNFVDYESFKNIFEKYLDFVKDNYELIINSSVLNGIGYSLIFVPTNIESKIDEVKTYYKELYSLIRYAGEILRTMTLEELTSYVNLFSNQSSQEVNVEAFILFSKKFVSTFTLFGEHASDVKNDISKIINFATENPHVMTYITFMPYTNQTSHMLPKFNVTSSELIAEIEYASGLDVTNISDEDSERITLFIQKIAPTSNEEMVAYNLVSRNPVTLNSTLEDCFEGLQKFEYYGESQEPTLININELNVTGFDTSTYGFKILNLTYDNFDFTFAYIVGDSSGYSNIQTLRPMENDYQLDYWFIKNDLYDTVYMGDFKNSVKTSDLIGFSTSEPGEHIAFYKNNDVYYAFKYIVCEKIGEPVEEYYLYNYAYEGMTLEELKNTNISYYKYQEYGYTDYRGLYSGMSSPVVSNEYEILNVLNYTESEFNNLVKTPGTYEFELEVRDMKTQETSTITINIKIYEVISNENEYRSQFFNSGDNFLPNSLDLNSLIGQNISEEEVLILNNNGEPYHRYTGNYKEYTITDIVNIDEIDQFSNEEQNVIFEAKDIETGEIKNITIPFKFVTVQEIFMLDYFKNDAVSKDELVIGGTIILDFLGMEYEFITFNEDGIERPIHSNLQLSNYKITITNVEFIDETLAIIYFNIFDKEVSIEVKYYTDAEVK